MLPVLPDPNLLAVFLVATVALNLSPGPDMFYVISRSLEQGRRAGIVSALGVGAGTLVHTLVTAVGLSAILVSIPVAFDAIRYAGAAYLAYLGLRILLAKRQDKTTATPEHDLRASLWGVFRQGVLTNVLNPKVALFFLAFLPQFVDSSRGPVALQIALLGLIFDTSGTSWNILIAAVAGQVSGSLGKRSGFSVVQRRLPGIILLALAILVVVR
jgi:threonine/homoserine/homoserine lactone efflux protein